MDQPTESGNEESESLWKQHGVIVDLYKFFFGWVLKLDIFYYAAGVWFHPNSAGLLEHAYSRKREQLHPRRRNTLTSRRTAAAHTGDNQRRQPRAPKS